MTKAFAYTVFYSSGAKQHPQNIRLFRAIASEQVSWEKIM
jgi:hypothetical protein